jgi:DNA-binding MarR family transcriptional regulator
LYETSTWEEAYVHPTARELGIRLRDLMKIVRLIRQHRAADRSAVPPGMVGMLMQIDQLSTGCHARELAARTGLDPSTVSRAVAALVAHRLVERRANPQDKRASILAITPAGNAALADAEDWYADLLDRALAGWRPDEVENLSAALARFINDIEETLEHHDHLEAA